MEPSQSGSWIIKRRSDMIYYDLSEFSNTPFGRFTNKDENDNTVKNPHSGESFRYLLKKLLIQARQDKDQVIIDLSKIEYGIGSSFLEEAFGGLVRKEQFSAEELISSVTPLLVIKSDVPFYEMEISEYIREADKLKN